MEPNELTYRVTRRPLVGKLALVVGVIGLIASGIGFAVDKEQFFHSYLVAFVFWTTVALGGLFFVMLHHLVNAKWSVVVRRIAENFMLLIPVMGLFAIPVLLGTGELFHWSHPEAVEHDHLLQSKAPYLNTTFFAIRTVGYFAIWSLLALILMKKSLKLDADPAGHESIFKRVRTISAPGMILFAVTITYAAFDWLMSLDPHWYSTIFGVYIFSGSFLCFMALLTLTVFSIQRHGMLRNEISSEHYHDLGKLMFAFVIFWGYMAFSQYFLIWYGNIPEETQWFLDRWEGSWRSVTLLIVFGHFVVPFFLLFPQPVKRNVPMMRMIAIWLAVMHWVDIYWIVMPTLHPDGAGISWIDVTTMLGIGGVFVWFLWNRICASPLVPVGDPYLKKSIEFTNI